MKNLIYFWRLEREKGAHLLPELQKKFANQNFRLFVFGEGSLKRLFEPFFTPYTEPDRFEGKPGQKIYFFWWQPKAKIKSWLAHADLTLMPSVVLESFGLSALESLAGGVPVVGPAKWGLKESILPPFDLGSNRAWELQSFLIKIQQVFQGKINPAEFSSQAKKMADSYTSEAWFQRFKSLFPHEKKILLVSDFWDPKAWGIEQHLAAVVKILQDKGLKVEVLAAPRPKSQISKLSQLATSFTNFKSPRVLQKKLTVLEPDLVRIHSISKYRWPKIFLPLKNYQGKVAITYHDFTLFAPFASKLVSENQLPSERELKEFIASQQPMSLVGKIYAALKFFKNSAIKKRATSLWDVHIVPSKFMTKTLKIWDVPDEKIKVLPHFYDLP